MENENNTFRYTYSAKERAELERIRNKYIPQQEDKIAQLRKLDARASRKAVAVALTMGVLGMLVMGFGMSLFMTDLGQLLHMSNAMLFGVIIGLAGILLAAPAYPLYQRMLQKERKKIAPQILRLTDELMK